MPTYNYRCRDNSHFYSENRSITEDQKNTKCPECGSELKRIFDAPSIQFNGTGFYKTSH